MNTHELLDYLIDKYVHDDSDGDYDWRRIPDQQRRIFALAFLRENELELDFFASSQGIKALNAMLDLIVYGHCSTNGSRMILNLLSDYQPAIDLFERKREEYLLENSFIGEQTVPLAYE